MKLSKINSHIICIDPSIYLEGMFANTLFREVIITLIRRCDS